MMYLSDSMLQSMKRLIVDLLDELMAEDFLEVEDFGVKVRNLGSKVAVYVTEGGKVYNRVLTLEQVSALFDEFRIDDTQPFTMVATTGSSTQMEEVSTSPAKIGDKWIN